MFQKNERIYHDLIPEQSSLPKIEKLIKGVPLQIPVISHFNTYIYFTGRLR